MTGPHSCDHKINKTRTVLQLFRQPRASAFEMGSFNYDVGLTAVKRPNHSAGLRNLVGGNRAKP
jgi:hypothetical protein